MYLINIGSFLDFFNVRYSTMYVVVGPILPLYVGTFDRKVILGRFKIATKMGVLA